MTVKPDKVGDIKKYQKYFSFIMAGFDNLELFLEYICKIDLTYLFIE